MIDAQTAVQSAIYAKLSATSAVTDLAEVWQNPPENKQPPLVIIGLVSLSAGDLKSGDLDTATISVWTQVRKADATVLYALNSAVRNALEDQAVSASGALIGNPVFLSADPKLMDDGLTYEDELRFEMFVQPA